LRLLSEVKQYLEGNDLNNNIFKNFIYFNYSIYLKNKINYFVKFKKKMKNMSVGKIFFNGTIITMNDNQFNVEAIGIERERIVAVGDLDYVKNKLKDAELINLNEKTLLPGFHDCHCHPIIYIFFIINLNLRDLRSFQEFKSILKKTGINRKKGEFIFGLSYDELNFKNLNERILPDRWLLDDLCPNNPVFILRFDGHIGIANTKALEVAGITAESKPPEGSEYRKNEKGELTGVLTEKAVGMVVSQYALPKPERIKEAAAIAFKNLAQKGITTLHGIVHLGAGGEAGDIGAIEIPIMKSVQALILQNWYILVYTDTPNKLKRIKRPPLDGGKEDSQFKLGALKLYIDGSLGACTAWMHQPFSDQSDKSGFCVYDNLENLYEQMKIAHNMGFQIGTHAIGDKANRVVVDLYKRLLSEFPRDNHRHRIEHASLLTDDVIKDMNKFRIIASIQPSFITTDAKLASYRLGDERSKYTYPFKSLIDGGVVCVSGSDCPIEDPDVIWGLHALVNRNGFVPEQCLNIVEALKTYTINAAYAAFEENIKGSIEEGKLADLVILDKNPLEVPKEKIKDINIMETIIRGKTAYKKE
jgi:predicted amidohydrolase YtcJ